MKKLLLLCAVALTLTSCKMNDYVDNISEAPSGMVILDYTSSYDIYVDRYTGVMYLSIYHGGLCVMVNPDGTPRIWKGEL